MNITSTVTHTDLRNGRHFSFNPSAYFVIYAPVLITIECISSRILQNDTYRLNDTISSLLMFIMERAPGLTVSFLMFDCYRWLYKHICIVETSFDCPIRMVLLWILVDFLFYWHHRAMHELNILWTVHQHHHSSEEYNLAAALRQPYLQNVYGWLFYTPLAFFVDPTTMFIHLGLNSSYQFFVHTRYFKSLGPLEYIMNTPSHHRVHHGKNPACIDRNYAGVFIIWDRMFGTFTPESDVDNIAYGIVSPVNTFNIFKSQCMSVIQLIKKAVVSPGACGKIKALFYGPGWSAGKSRLGELSDIPEVEPPRRVYDVKMPLWLKVYVFLHFITFLIIEHPLATKFILQHTLPEDRKRLIIPSLGLFVMFTVSVLGSLMDGSKRSSVMECFRCMAAICVQIFVWKPLYTAHHVPSSMNIVYSAFLLVSAVFWLARIICYQSSYTHYECTSDKCKRCRALIT